MCLLSYLQHLGLKKPPLCSPSCRTPLASSVVDLQTNLTHQPDYSCNRVSSSHQRPTNQRIDIALSTKQIFVHGVYKNREELLVVGC